MITTGLYVGSFDPVHRGHVNLITQLLSKGYIEQAVIVATGDYWDKRMGAALSDRLAMLKLCADKRMLVDTTHNQLTYTYQIMDALQTEHPDWRLHLIIGDDLIPEFSRWQRVERLKETGILLIDRAAINIDQYIDRHDPGFIIVDDIRKFPAASRTIRRLIQKGTGDAELLAYLDPMVLAYIRANNLYK